MRRDEVIAASGWLPHYDLTLNSSKCHRLRKQTDAVRRRKHTDRRDFIWNPARWTETGWGDPTTLTRWVLGGSLSEARGGCCWSGFTVLTRRFFQGGRPLGSGAEVDWTALCGRLRGGKTVCQSRVYRCKAVAAGITSDVRPKQARGYDPKEAWSGESVYGTCTSGVIFGLSQPTSVLRSAVRCKD